MIMENNTGSYYYELFKFFNDQHNLTLLDSEIQEIIKEVERFQEKKMEEKYFELHQAVDDDEDDFYEDYKNSVDEREQRANTCTCGAWVFNKSGSVVHVSDCICGAQ